MVYPAEEKIEGRTLEDRLAKKFDALQVARENRNGDLFDELSKSIEVLLIGVPDAHRELMREKEKLDKDLEEELYDIERGASYAKDDIQRQLYKQTEGYKVMWEYREVYEEIIMEVMQKFRLIPLRYIPRSTVEAPKETPKRSISLEDEEPVTTDFEPIKEGEPFEIDISPEPEPPKPKKKSRLLRKKR
mgnify:CR=1 FL=1